MNQIRKLLLWRLATVRGVLYSLVMLGSCWMTALNKLDWSELQWDDKRNILIGIFVSWGTMMVAFLDKTMNEISTGHIPGMNEDQKP